MSRSKRYNGATSQWEYVEDTIPSVPAPPTMLAGSNSIVWKEVPTGAINGTNKVFTTLQPYIPGSLQVYVNGVAESGMVAETNHATGTFTLDTAPLTGWNIYVSYQYAASVTGNADTLDGYHLSGILDAIFPVGSKYDSGDSPTLPPLIASIGTWERFKGRVVVGVDEAQTEFDAVGEQGGAKTHTLTEAQMPSHRHFMDRGRWWGNDSVLGGNDSIFNQQSSTTAQGESASGGGSRKAIGLTGGGQPHNNLQPYETTYMWKRTA